GRARSGQRAWRRPVAADSSPITLPLEIVTPASSPPEKGFSFDPIALRSYLGGVSLSSALVIVSRYAPVNLRIARYERLSTKDSRLISAHFATPIALLLAQSLDQARFRDEPDDPPTRRQVVQFS